MKRVNAAIFVCVAFSGLTNAAERKVAYEHGGNIFVADLDGSRAKKIATAAYPSISPDGTRVAFNAEQHPTRLGLERHIAVADVATGKATFFKDIPSNNCFGPVWSRDGSQIAFYIMSEGDWQIGVVKSNGSDFRFLKKAGPNNNSFWSMCWAPQDHSFFCQDLTNLYQFAVDGSLIKRWDIGKLTGGGSMSSGTRLDVSPNGRRIIFDVDLAEESTRKNWDGAPPGIFVLDLETDSATRVSAKGLYAFDPQFISDDEFLCLIQKENENEGSIYRVSMDGKNSRRLIKNARFPSVSAPKT